MENKIFLEGTIKRGTIKTLPGGVVRFDVFHCEDDRSKLLIMTVFAKADLVPRILQSDSFVHVEGKVIFASQFAIEAISVVVKEAACETA